HAGMGRPGKEILPLPQMLQMHRRAAPARSVGEVEAKRMGHQVEACRPARRFGFVVCRLRFQLLPPKVRLVVTLTLQGGQGVKGRGLAPVIGPWAFLWIALLCLAGFAVSNAAWAAQDTPAAVGRCKELIAGFDEHPGPITSEVQGSAETNLGVRLSWARG